MGALDCTCYCGGKPILIRCSLLTTEQDALVDNESVCNCADGWHTDVALRQEA